MNDPGATVGIIAGSGELPLEIARALSRSGRRLFVAGLKNAALPELKDPSWDTEWVDFFRLGDLLSSLKNAGVSEVILAGHVDHRGIFRGERFDDRMRSFIEGLGERGGSSVLSAFTGLLAREGFRVPSLLDVVPELVPSESFIAGPNPDPAAAADLSLGWNTARRLADLDIGQTVVLKNGAVIAVEGMEGTDETVKRALGLAGNGLTVVKRAARDHDFRFDVPTIGKRTVEVLSEGGGGSILLETGRCFILGREEVISLCDRKGVSLVICREDENGAISWASN